MLEEDQEDVDFAEIRSHLDELADHDMNGRVIRNALTTARQLALYRGQRLCWDHLHSSLRLSVDFNVYLKRVHGHTDEQWVKDQGWR